MYLISIIIPTYNRAHLIGETLDSILAQTYPNWECIIVDDGSTDDTQALIQNYMSKDNRFRFYKRPENRLKGPSACRNYGFEMSNGEYVNWFDSDDVMLPEKLEFDLKNIQSGSYDFTISQSEFFGETNTVKKKYWNTHLYSEQALDDFVLKKIGWGVNSPLWKRKSLIQNHLKFDEDLLTEDDYFFHIEALRKKLSPHINSNVLVKLRVHENRLENYKIKSSYKLKVLYNLLNNKDQLKRNTVDQLLKRSLRQLSNSFKHKNYKTGMDFSFKFIKLKLPSTIKKDILRLMWYGTFYNFFGSGYKYLTKFDIS